ncbi:MAG TPA: beta-propeller fold lactonase family protein [Solirubrobacterales bacterium]
MFALALVPVGSAGAATNLSQKDGIAGCVTETGSYGCLDGRGLVGATSIALSANGENAYVASPSWNSVSILARNPVDGALAPISNPTGCFDAVNFLYPDCTQVRELGGAGDIAVSPDGKNVYVAAPSDDAVIIFDRDPISGALTLSTGIDGCVNEDGTNTCVDGRALDGATSVIVSPDNLNVYAASSGPNGGLAIFDRDTGTGDLTQKPGAPGCVNETAVDSCTDGLNQMLDVRDVQISPDGKTVYAASRTRDAVTIYTRNESNGELTPVSLPDGCIKNGGGGGCQGGLGLIEARSVTVSPDGATAYVAGERSDAVAIFDRDSSTGLLTQKAGTAGCYSNTGESDPSQAGTLGDCQDGIAMDGIDSIAILPDGSALYAATGASDGVAVFERHPNGTLTQRPGSAGCFTETGYEDPGLSWTKGVCEDGRALIGADRIVASSDSRFVYTAAPGGGIGVFDVVEPPPPSPPAAADPPPGEPPPSVTLECRQAREDLRQAKGRLKHAQGAIRWQRRLAQRTSNPVAKQKLSRAIKKNRGAVKRWGRVARHARARVENLCP